MNEVRHCVAKVLKGWRGGGGGGCRENSGRIVDIEGSDNDEYMISFDRDKISVVG